MFMQGSFLGISFLEQVFSNPIAVLYNKVEIFGDCKIDKVRCLNTELTDEEVDGLRFFDEYLWQSNVLMLAEFNNTLAAGNIQGITNPITNWEIYRKESSETVYSLLETVDLAVESYTDHRARAYRNYDYRVFAVNSTEISTPLDAPTVYTDWYHWSLTDEESGTVYLFDLDLASGQVSRVQDVTYYDSSFSKYTPRTYGERDFVEGSISATGGSIDCAEADSLDYSRTYIETLGAFINNGKNKILKSRYGETWIVATNNFTYKHMDVIQRQLATINFTFRQVDDL